jgi:endonuclease/exonuclease/phosphatase family metal-dependent hydrolase
MRPPISQAVPELPSPDGALLEAARSAKSVDDHARFVPRVAALHALEQMEPRRTVAPGARLTVAAFNAERLKNVEATGALIDVAGAQATLLSEVDCGMARSGNRHAIRDLAGSRREGYVYGVEFVELDLGDPWEMRRHAGEHNARGLHGNGIVTGLRLGDAHVLPLEETGRWLPGREGAQRRIGGRMAVAARVADRAKPLWLVSVHLESHSGAADRAAQIRRLIAGLDALAPGADMVVGGDLNTKELPRDPAEWPLVLDVPDQYEPLFGHMRDAGFGWSAANRAEPTQRTGPMGHPEPPFGKLDWLFVRGVRAENPRVIPALSPEGRPLSDHEMVAADILLEG